MGSRMHFAANSARPLPRWLNRNNNRRRNWYATSAAMHFSTHSTAPGVLGQWRREHIPDSAAGSAGPAPVAQRLAGHHVRPTADRDVDATGWRAGTPAAHTGGMPTALEARKRALPMPDGALARRHRSLAFDRLLESVHREHLSPFDLRVLLRSPIAKRPSAIWPSP